MSLDTRIQQWLSPPFDRATQAGVSALQKDTASLEDAFYTDLQFGTGGMRGKMGVGPNRINKYTLGKASQGLANYLVQDQGQGEGKKIVIAYDTRHNSQSFAQTIAHVFSANGIETFLFATFCPTPLLSYAVRYLKAHAGIVLTASHNPPAYNGYKVYNAQGGQITPPEDRAIINRIEQTKFEDIQWQPDPNLITLLDNEVLNSYFNNCLRDRIWKKTSSLSTQIVFSPLHGTAVNALPELLQRAGYSHISLVKEQSVPSGDFPTVVSPNPEEHEAFDLAIKQAEKENAQIVMATDPDADRIGIGIKNPKNQWMLINGNQLMVLLLRFVVENKPHSKNAFVASTIVSTPLVEKIAHSNEVECKLTLTGFKWIGKLIHDHPKQDFLCGGEESNGFLLADSVRDKDALSTALLVADMHSALTEKGLSIYDYLMETYLQYGCFHETLIAIKKEGKKGEEEIEKMMSKLRHQPLSSIDKTPIVCWEDYQSSERFFSNGQKEKIDLPQSNVIRLHLEDGRRVALRPSGTEPKIKFYFSAHCPMSKKEDYPQIRTQLENKISDLSKALDALL